MNYYIQGNAAKAKQIKAAFEANGFNTSGINFENKTLLYFSFEGCIKHCSDDWFFTRLIKTHPDYQELPLSVEPKFKVGDSLQSGCMYAMVRRIDTENQRYVCQFDNIIPFKEQNLWSLVPNPKPHYDISNFHAGMPVLVRDGDCHEWRYVTFSHYRKVGTPFCAGGQYWFQCIPYNNDTKHLLGTTDMCPEEYINW